MRGSIKIYRRNLFVSQCRNFSYVNPSVVFQKISGGEKFMVKRGGGEYQNFPSRLFCFTVTKNVVGEHFKVSLILGIENFVFQRFMSLFSIFCRIFFVSQC